jgi:protein phosphatase
LGTRNAEFLRPTVQRFVLEEDGLLLLCSDGLSDNGWVEQSWPNYAPAVLAGKLSLESAVESLIALANEQNGHDNTSVVLTYCRVSPEHPVLFEPIALPSPTDSLESEFSAASQALLQGEEVEATEPAIASSTKTKSARGALALLGLLALLLVGGAVGLVAWWQLDPKGFQQMRDRLPPDLNRVLPPQ